MKTKKCLNCNIKLENNTENFCEACIGNFSKKNLKIEYGLEEITPLINHLSEEITNSIFEKFWKENKRKIKDLSKKEIAIQMYFEGLSEALGLSALSGMPKEFYENLLFQVKFVNFLERFSE